MTEHTSAPLMSGGARKAWIGGVVAAVAAGLAFAAGAALDDSLTLGELVGAASAAAGTLAAAVGTIYGVRNT